MDDTDSIPTDNSILTIIKDASAGIQYKLFVFMFVLFLIINSDVFIGRILARFDGAVKTLYPTSWGTIIQALMLISAGVMVDAFIKNEII